MENPTLYLSKGVGKLADPISQKSENFSWNILKEEVSFPAAAISQDKLIYNLNWMEEFIDKFQVKNKILLAPHGKTSMIPSLFKKVCESSTTWGMTFATASQVKVAHEFGINKIIMANQLVGKRNMEIISDILEKNKNFEFICIVDSPENVEQLGTFFSEKNQILKVLLEYGPPQHGRTGIRNEKQEQALLEAIKNWNESVKVVGVEFFEGVLQDEQEICKFIDQITLKTKGLLEAQVFDKTSSIIITGAGSSWFDIVADKLSRFACENEAFPIQIILRPGCYMIHDIGRYMETSERIQCKGLMENGLKPALKIWAYVQSIPENDLAILSFGKRDAADDSGMPLPALHFRPGGDMTTPTRIRDNAEISHWHIVRMMDQHTFLRIKDGDDLRVGDLLAFDIAHPCTTIDKWRNLLLIDENFNVVDVYSTYF